MDAGLARRRLLLDGWCLLAPRSTMTIDDVLAVLGPLASSRSIRIHCCDLRPYDKDSAPPASMSATTGTNAQPLHTDGAYCHVPPRYVALQCLEPGEARCPTLLCTLDLRMLEGERSALLTRPVWVSQGGGLARFYCPVLDRYGETLRVRFDPLCMRTRPAASHAADEVRAALERCAQEIEIEWVRGSLLLIDNWRCLHARGEGAAEAPSRRLRRWVIGANDGLVA